MRSSTVIVPTLNGAVRLERLLSSLDDTDDVLVIDNASTDGTREMVARCFPHVEVLALDYNAGFSRAVNLGVEHIDSNSFVLLNDDCICEPGFVSRMVDALNPSKSVVMVAGVLLERADPGTLDSAGIELDETLLVFDYLNGRPVEAMHTARPPVGPSGAAAAFDRGAFRDAGGFDEMLFAYWEDVDLALRLRVLGAECALAGNARAYHALSSTLGSGSPSKNYLTGFGRGYMLRKWSVVEPRRLAKILARDGAICTGQALIDRNLTGIRGRVVGWRAAAGVSRQPYPISAFSPSSVRLGTEIGRRWARRRRIAEAGSVR